MRAHLLNFWNLMRASYWFWPSVMSIASILLSIVAVKIDAHIGSDWPQKIPFIYANQPAGARALLATVAGSMITVSGITFSLTLLAVSHATSQYGPRLLSNFMQDRGNQVTLGTFVSTFLYCLMVLRTVRSAEEGQNSPTPPSGDLLGAFVPHLSIFIALTLTLISAGVLIYFIHHIAESIRLSNVTAQVGRNLTHSVKTVFPESIGHAEEEHEQLPPELPEDYKASADLILAKHDGYLQTIDSEGLLQTAREHGLILEMRATPGDFISAGQALLQFYPPQTISDETKGELQFMFVQGAYRTATDNILFLVDQFVEIIARALSPGVNDPITAMNCMDWMQSALIEFSHRRTPDSFRHDREGQLRIIAPGITFEIFADRFFSQIRPYVSTDRNAALHLLKVIGNVLEFTSIESRSQRLLTHAQELLQNCELHGLSEIDMKELRQLHHVCLKAQRNPDPAANHINDHDEANASA